MMLTLIPPACIFCRPWKLSFSSQFPSFGEVCPRKTISTAKELASTVRFCTICAFLVPIVGVIGGMTLNFTGLETLQYDPFLVTVDTIVLLVYWTISQAVVGHTAMLYNYHIMICRGALKNLRKCIQNYAPMELVKKHAIIQKRIVHVGNTFGLYLGVNLLLCVLASTFFVGRIPHEKKIASMADFFTRVFFYVLFIVPTIYSLYKTGQLGSEGEHVIRDFMKCDPEMVKGNFEEYNFAINYFALKLRCGEVGLRVYDFALTYKTIAQIFSIWTSLLSLMYATASRGALS